MCPFAGRDSFREFICFMLELRLTLVLTMPVMRRVVEQMFFDVVKELNQIYVSFHILEIDKRNVQTRT